MYSLQVMFAVIGSEFTAFPWLVYEAIKTQGVNLFADAAEVRHTNAMKVNIRSIAKPQKSIFGCNCSILSSIRVESPACCSQVTLANSTDDVLHNLASGRIDAAILRSDVIAHAQLRGLLNAATYKHVDAVSQANSKCYANT